MNGLGVLSGRGVGELADSAGRAPWTADCDGKRGSTLFATRSINPTILVSSHRGATGIGCGPGNKDPAVRWQLPMVADRPSCRRARRAPLTICGSHPSPVVRQCAKNEQAIHNERPVAPSRSAQIPSGLQMKHCSQPHNGNQKKQYYCNAAGDGFKHLGVVAERL
jgi:hypothetical protein